MNLRKRKKKSNCKQKLRRKCKRKSEKSSWLNRRKSWRENSKILTRIEMILLSGRSRLKPKKKRTRFVWKSKWTSTSKTPSQIARPKKPSVKQWTTSLLVQTFNRFSKPMKNLSKWCSSFMPLRIKKMITHSSIWNTSIVCSRSRKWSDGVISNR